MILTQNLIQTSPSEASTLVFNNCCRRAHQNDAPLRVQENDLLFQALDDLSKIALQCIEFFTISSRRWTISFNFRETSPNSSRRFKSMGFKIRLGSSVLCRQK
jgi:hypothetical protein